MSAQDVAQHHRQRNRRLQSASTDLETAAARRQATARRSASLCRNRSFDDSELVFVFETGEWLMLKLDADCCSHPTDPRGNRILSGEGRFGDERDENGSILHHAVILRTDRQSITLMWRNVSNGYYDGSCRVHEGSAPLVDCPI